MGEGDDRGQHLRCEERSLRGARERRKRKRKKEKERRKKEEASSAVAFASPSPQRSSRCPCSYDKGLRELYPSFDGFPVVGRGKAPWSPRRDFFFSLLLLLLLSLLFFFLSSSPPGPLLERGRALGPPGSGRAKLRAREDAGVPRARGGAGERERQRKRKRKRQRRRRADFERRQRKEEKERRGNRRVFVVAHSGWIEQLLVGVGRKGFVPENAELVPLLVQRKEGSECQRGVALLLLLEVER